MRYAVVVSGTSEVWAIRRVVGPTDGTQCERDRRCQGQRRVGAQKVEPGCVVQRGRRPGRQLPFDAEFTAAGGGVGACGVEELAPGHGDRHQPLASRGGSAAQVRSASHSGSCRRERCGLQQVDGGQQQETVHRQRPQGGTDLVRVALQSEIALVNVRGVCQDSGDHQRAQQADPPVQLSHPPGRGGCRSAGHHRSPLTTAGENRPSITSWPVRTCWSEAHPSAWRPAGGTAKSRAAPEGAALRRVRPPGCPGDVPHTGGAGARAPQCSAFSFASAS